MARPNRFDTDVKPRFDEIAEWVKGGATDNEVAENLGINKSTLCDYKNKHPELTELLKNARRKPVKAIKAALFKRATGFVYTEKKKIVEYEEWSDEIKDALMDMGIDVDNLEKRKLVREEYYEKYALPDPASAMILLKHWDTETEWTQDPAMLKLKKEEFEFKKQHLENDNW